jgi:hypothetical protein
VLDKAAIREALLARILQEDEAAIRAALAIAMTGVTLDDCMPEDGDLPWKEIMISWEDLEKRLFTVRLPRVP